MLEDACKEMGLSDEAAEQITTAYGKQAEEKINKVNSMVEFVAKQVKIEREKFYQEHGEPAYRVGSSPARNTTGKDSVEVNKESNSDIYKMFANLDVSSKENFKSSFENALAGFGNYFRRPRVQWVLFSSARSPACTPFRPTLLHWAIL